MSSTRPTAGLVAAEIDTDMERAGLKADHHLPVPAPPTAGSPRPTIPRCTLLRAGNSSWRAHARPSAGASQAAIPPSRTQCASGLACGRQGARRNRSRTRRPRGGRRPGQDMHQADNKPYHPIPRRERVRRHDGPTPPSRLRRAVAESACCATATTGGRRATGAGAQPPPPRARRGPPAIYRADRRAQSRTERPDLALVPGVRTQAAAFHWWYLLAIPRSPWRSPSVSGATGLLDLRQGRGRRATHPTPGRPAPRWSTPTAACSAPRPARGARLRRARPRAGPSGQDPARCGFDPRTHNVSQLSIPRDTLVSLPGYGQTKINEAYFWGGAASWPSRP